MANSHYFDTLLGDPDQMGRRRRLPVDGYFPGAGLLVEYHERCHANLLARSVVRLLINLEGLDGAGKSTQARLLADHLRAAGFPVHVIHFPAYDTPTGEMIAACLRGELSLAGERVQELFAENRREVAPELLRRRDAGEVVILDRYYPSAWAYGVARGFPEEWLVALDAGLPAPDLVVVLDVPVEVVVERMAGRQADRYERDQAFLAAVRRAYLDLAGRKGWHVIVNDREPEEIGDAMFQFISAFQARSGTPR